MTRPLDHIYIALTIALTVYGQLIIKWQVNQAGSLPPSVPDKLLFFSRLLLNPWVLSSLTAAFFAAIAWMGAMTKFPLSYAYPFVGSTFVLILIGSGLFLGETINSAKVIGTFLIIIGIIIASKG